jgi:hypothetical protein
MLDRTPQLTPSRTPESSLTVELLSVHIGSDGGPPHLDVLVQKRLGIIRRGLREARRQVRCGQDEDAVVLVEKLEEDLQMLQNRVARAVDSAASRTE